MQAQLLLPASPDKRRGTAWALVTAAAFAALLLGRLSPAVGALLIALLLGIGLANVRPPTPALSSELGRLTRNLLRWGIVLLGLKLSLSDIAAIGWRGALIVLLTVTLTFRVTTWVGHRLGLDHDLVTLMAGGFSICGAAAIAAISDVIEARQRNVALAVAMVTIFGGAMIGFVPWAAGGLGLSQRESALWVGASIHEVAQVVAAAAFVGGNAVALAMLIKLARVATLAPICALVGRGRSNAPLVPWFLIGFALCVLLRSIGVLPTVVLSGAEALTTLLLAAGMFGLGLALRFRDLWPLPPALLALATVSTATALGTSLLLIITLC